MSRSIPRSSTLDTTLAAAWLARRALSSGFVDDWLLWARGPRGRGLVKGWLNSAEVSAVWTADQVARPVSGAETNRLQRVLVNEAQQGGEAAALTLLVQLRPGLSRVARAAAGWEHNRHLDGAEEAQATFFEVVYRMNLERRGRAVAANLILDTRQGMWRRRTAQWPQPGREVAPSQGDRPTDEVTDGVVVLLDVHRHLATMAALSPSQHLSASIAWRAWIQDQPVSVIAADLGLNRHTVDSRLYRVRKSLPSSVRERAA